MINNNLLYSVVSGEGPTVILIHGMAASLNDWGLMLPALARAGYRTYAVDLLGHGESAKPEHVEHYTMKAVYGTLEEWIERLDARPPYFLVGHSMGGYLSLKLSLRHPEWVRRIALINPMYSTQQLSPIFRVLHRQPELGIKLLERVPHQIVDAALRFDPTLVRDFPLSSRQQIVSDVKRASPHILNIPRTIPDLTHELPYVHTPALVIWGDHDRTLEPRSFPLLVSSLPDARGHPVPGCGHQPHRSQPALVNSLVIEFLSGAAG